MKGSWLALAAIHQVQAVRSAYIWFAVVPVAARILDSMPDQIHVDVMGRSVALNMALPFSWLAFFWAAAAFAASNLVYIIFCPQVLKDHRSFESFQSEGKSFNHLDRYNENIGKPVSAQSIRPESWAAPEAREFRDDEAREKERESFWNLHEIAECTRPKARAVCAGLLVIGFALLAIVVAQSFWFVCGVTLKTITTPSP